MYCHINLKCMYLYIYIYIYTYIYIYICISLRITPLLRSSRNPTEIHTPAYRLTCSFLLPCVIDLIPHASILLKSAPQELIHKIKSHLMFYTHTRWLLWNFPKFHFITSFLLYRPITFSLDLTSVALYNQKTLLLSLLYG